MGGQLSEAHKVLQWDRLFSLSSALVHFPEKRQVWKPIPLTGSFGARSAVLHYWLPYFRVKTEILLASV